MSPQERQVIEAVAEIEHAQWEHWSRSVASEVGEATRCRWNQYWVPYAELPEAIKEIDREWARRTIEVVKPYSAIL